MMRNHFQIMDITIEKSAQEVYDHAEEVVRACAGFPDSDLSCGLTCLLAIKVRSCAGCAAGGAREDHRIARRTPSGAERGKLFMMTGRTYSIIKSTFTARTIPPPKP